ncbi:lipopolysaccharide biosynthesis protein [Macromonas nakdongensis]|uniref:lipopolysaccharide biosynthesis protein n=1 Tax=Macromonas nakdongensis TaxID=1843082 RepID=UPI001E535165
MPVYLNYLSPEAFGLVGIFLLAQSLIQLLDMGLTPTLSREIARMRAKELSPQTAIARVQSIKWIIRTLALVITLATWLCSDLIAAYWISTEKFSTSSISTYLSLIGCTSALRWLSGMYRGILAGLEEQQKINKLSAIFATLRFIGPIPIFIFISTTPESFLIFQLFTSALELAAFSISSHDYLPKLKKSRQLLLSLRETIPMVSSMAFLNGIWILQTQTDKFILSGILSLNNYGHLTLATAVASGVFVLIAPMNQVIQPRLNYLLAKSELKEFIQLYRLSSQFSAIGFFTLGISAAIFSEEIIYIWTGKKELINSISPVLFWYGLANSTMGTMLMPFMLQLAHGKLKLHAIGSSILLFISIPTLLIVTPNFGATGAAFTFFTTNMLFLLAWSPIVHKKFIPYLQWRWLFLDIIPPTIAIASLLLLSSLFMPDGLWTPLALVWITCSMVLAGFGGILSGRHTCQYILKEFSIARNQNNV